MSSPIRWGIVGTGDICRDFTAALMMMPEVEHKVSEHTLLPAWISNYIHYKVWDEITYPFPNFNVEVWEWISNFIPHFIGHVITYPCWDLS